MAYATNSYGNYSGTIVSSPIRPFGPITNIATVFSNEIKGGHHTYEFLIERDSIIEERRDWGMLVTVYDDTTPSNNKTYKLEYNYSSPILMDNNNWIEYNPSGTITNSEWIDSIQEIASIPSGGEPDGYRYLVLSPGNFGFLGEDDKIAQYIAVSSTFIFIEPKNGTTLRLDTSPNTLYRYSGTYSSGTWVTEVLNSVRYLNAFSVDGITYSATSSVSPVTNLYESVYYVNFNATSSGTASLIIDGLTASQIFKLENNLLNNAITNDLIPNIQYQLIWNGTSFQTTLPSSSTTTIGPAEDGNYTDGVFTDFIPSTPIGTAVDRFNEFLMNLVPSSGPTLSSWISYGSFVNGGLSFDDSTSGGLTTATSSPYGSVSSGETFSNLDSYYRLGITSKNIQPITGTQFYSDISGILNINVAQDLQVPFPSYATYSFGFADSGTISLFLNGFTISQFGLTGGSIDTTSGGATSGISVSSPTASRFFNGNYYENYQNRTATYLIKSDSGDIVDGYNYFIIQHETNTNNYVLNQFEFVSDPSITDITVNNSSIIAVNSPFTKYLSGIQFFTTPMNFVHYAEIQSAFENTYNTDSDAVTYLDLSLDISGITNSITNTVTNAYTSSVVTPILLSSKLIPDTPFDPTATMTITMTYSLNNDTRRINDSLGFGFEVKRTVQGTFIGGTTSTNPPYLVDNWLIDSVLATSTVDEEKFDDENYRLLNYFTKFNTYNTTSDVLSGSWSSLASLYSDTSHYNGLQVINGILVYPKFNFSDNGPGNTFTNPNWGVGPSRDYEDCFTVNQGFGTYSGSPLTNNRTYTRWFFFGTPGNPVTNYNRGIIKINHEGTSFINANTPIVGNTNIWVEVKLPYYSGAVPGGTVSTGGVTGWLDATKPFTGTYEDGDGCLSGVVPTASAADWYVDFGVKGTEFSGGYVLLRVTAGQDWTGNISSIMFIPD